MSGLPRASRRAWGLLAGLAVALAGAWLAWRAYSTPVGPDTVSQVLVRTKPGLVGDAAETRAMFEFDTPDLYVVVTSDAGEVRLPTFDDTPVGSGLLFDLPEPVALSAVREVAVWDDDLVSDNLLDRVRVEPGEGVGGNVDRVFEGGRYRVVLRGRVAKPPTWALTALVACGVVAAGLGGKLVWDQVV